MSTIPHSAFRIPHSSNRRHFLKGASCGLGGLALTGLLNEKARAAPHSPLADKSPHHAPRAKSLIFLHMRGGPSAMDTFEHKPELYKRAGEERSGKRKLVGKNWEWKQRGESGLWVSDLVPHMARHADDLCVLSGMHTDIGNHTPAMLQLHTGNFQFTRPSMGAWIVYGLGTRNENVPGFIMMSPPLINGGSKNYGAAFLPAVYQGTAIGDINTPIADARVSNLENPRLGRAAQREQLNLLRSLNRGLERRDPRDEQVAGVGDSFELAYRMQSEMPELMDLSSESQATLDMYGIGEGKPTDNFGRQCLLARRMVEAGVRFIEITDEFWDQHRLLKESHAARALATDQPIGALLTDLKQRGLFDDTLLLWGGEFGRTPDTRQKDLDGRDHNIKGYTMWLAGAGTKGGHQHGATDELGYEAVEGRVHLHDLHATLLHLMGLDHERLTYRYSGRDFRLTDVYGEVVTEVLA